MNTVEVKGLSKTFQVKKKQPGLKGSLKSLFRPHNETVEAVRDVSFSIAQGELVALIGPNGAGKSTTIKMLCGILYPSAGEMRVLGMNPLKDRLALSKRIGTVFGQKSQLWFHLPAIDSLKLLSSIYELDKNYAKKRIDELTELFELAEFIDVPVRKLSLGQRVRCEIAASLLHEPEIIFLDEPTIGLDVIVKEKIRELIRTVNREKQTTVSLTSPDAGDIEKICHRAIVIDHGQVALDETIKYLKYNYLNSKQIGIKYEESVDLEALGLEVEKSKDNAYSLRIDTRLKSLDAVLTTLITAGSVRDMTIEEAPMEEVIRHIYQRQPQEGA